MLLLGFIGNSFVGLDSNSTNIVSLNDLSTFISERYDIRIPFKFEIRWRTRLFWWRFCMLN